MAYREILMELPSDQAEAWSDALLDAGALSVSVEDARAGEADEDALFGEPGMEATANAWRLSRLTALVADEAADGSAGGLAACLSEAAAALGLDAPPSYTARDLQEQDWVRLTQSQFPPMHIGEHIWVVPSWHDRTQEARDDPQSVILELDPGLAFGTGSHPTTRLCMAWLESAAADLRGGRFSRVLDYGCGSGILAIVAAKFGAVEVSGVDIDADAVTAARDNALRNHAAARFALPDELEAGQFGLVVANILSNPLKVMAGMLSQHVAPGGSLVLSGVLERQAREVAAAYAPWIALSVWRSDEGWVCLHGSKPAD
ncbi:MAG: 50S ribosomal protein L11 methyltransferase [Candidatus Protistobacter heckmanni]|nr:50S ribosomal protein L11 methyltransferase [Candidatus Protistobacter heckmanni]